MTGFCTPQPSATVVHQDEHSLPRHPTAAGTARHHARQVLADWGIGNADEVYDTLLVVSELVTNAVEHALPPIALRLEVTSAADGSTRLHADVTDGGPARCDGAWTTSCAAEEHGRGRQIITVLAECTTAGSCDRGAKHGPTLAPGGAEHTKTA
ncbi:ATP-binding protein [Streptomyces sp. NPDC056254]|uniref:ATP-binding protein n=1 Tax=Streptomyces sp. NPDC056254 TaxID=3345763 RepID=UPI0035D9966E